jgi:SAM-dependent methyltransferase
MHESLLSILRDPYDGSELGLVDAEYEAGEIFSGSLRSAGGRSHPIVRGIPRFVPDDDYTQSFGEQWNAYRTVQLDSARSRTMSADRFDAELGWTEADLGDRLVLDAGSGAGRFAEIAAQRGARVVAVDSSSAVEATRATLAGIGVTDVVQADVTRLPFAKSCFDFAYSIGVIQHTHDPRGAIRAIVESVAPGGRYGLTIYGRRPWTKLNAKYLVRPLTRRLPSAVVRRLVEGVMPVVFPVTDVLFRAPLVGPLFKFTIPIANYIENDHLTREQRYEEAVLDTVDMLTPAYDSPMTWQEVREELLQIPVQRVLVRSMVPVTVVGTR